MKINNDFIFRKEFDGTAILLKQSDGTVFYLNTISTVIFEMLQQGADKARIMAGLAKKVNNLPESASADVDNLLESMIKNGILLKE